jgi:hypothetical protein
VSFCVVCTCPALSWLRCVGIVLSFGVGGCLRCAGCFFLTPALVCTKRTDSFCTGWYLLWLDRQAELPLLLLCEACRACEVRLFVCLDKWGIVCAVLVCVLPARFSAGVASALLHATLHTPHRCSQLILPIHPCTCTCSLGAYVPYRH